MVEVWVDGAQRVCQARGPNLDDFARIAVLDGAHGAEAHEWVGSVGRAPDRFECERGRLAAEQLDGGRARQPRRVGVFGKIHECAGRIGGAVPPAPDRLAVVRRTRRCTPGR